MEDYSAADLELTPQEVAASRAETEAAVIDGTSMLLERDAGGTEYLHFEDDGFTIERVVDVEPVLDWCKGRFNAGLANSLSEFRQIASLPPSVLDIWGKVRGLPPQWYSLKEYHNLVVQAAHDRDLSGFRTLAGHFIRRG